MKKYQLWLERKSYSQHLFNLIKIKNSHHTSVQKLEHSKVLVRASSRQNSTMTKYKQLEEYHKQSKKLGDISYVITYKQLKNHKLRAMKTFEILNENMSMARRIKEAKSVLNITSKEKFLSQNNKRKLFQKKCELSNQEIREQNFKKFKNWQRNKTIGLFQFYLTVTVESISKILHSQHQYAAAWCQISAEKDFVRSQLVPINHFQGKQLNFSFQTPLSKECLFKIYICKGLNSEIIGQFYFKRPELGQLTITNHYSDDGLFEVTLKLLYNKHRKQKLIFNPK